MSGEEGGKGERHKSSLLLTLRATLIILLLSSFGLQQLSAVSVSLAQLTYLCHFIEGGREREREGEKDAEEGEKRDSRRAPFPSLSQFLSLEGPIYIFIELKSLDFLRNILPSFILIRTTSSHQHPKSGQIPGGSSTVTYPLSIPSTPCPAPICCLFYLNRRDHDLLDFRANNIRERLKIDGISTIMT